MITEIKQPMDELAQRIERLERENTKKMPSLMNDFDFNNPPPRQNQRNTRNHGNQSKYNQRKEMACTKSWK